MTMTKVKNPKTGYLVEHGGQTYKRLIKQGYKLVDGELVLPSATTAQSATPCRLRSASATTSQDDFNELYLREVKKNDILEAEIARMRTLYINELNRNAQLEVELQSSTARGADELNRIADVSFEVMEKDNEIRQLRSELAIKNEDAHKLALVMKFNTINTKVRKTFGFTDGNIDYVKLRLILINTDNRTTLKRIFGYDCRNYDDEYHRLRKQRNRISHNIN